MFLAPVERAQAAINSVANRVCPNTVVAAFESVSLAEVGRSKKAAKAKGLHGRCLHATLAFALKQLRSPQRTIDRGPIERIDLHQLSTVRRGWPRGAAA